MATRDDFGKLEAWQRLFESGQVLVSATSAAMAEEIVDLIKQGFRDETDPYGKRWAPKKKPDGRKVLSGETSRLKSGWHVTKTNAGGFTVGPSVDYAAAHQAPKRGAGGKLKRPRRMMVPSGRGMPALWRKALRETAVEVARGYYSTERVRIGKARTGRSRQVLRQVLERAHLSLNINGLLRAKYRDARDKAIGKK